MDFHIPRIPSEVFMPPEHQVARGDYADVYYDRLTDAIIEFQERLDDDHEVAIRLVSFGQSVVIHVTDVGYRNPKLIVFYGLTQDGNPVELIQHVSQISFLLIAERKLDPNAAPRRIGFNRDDAS